MVRQFEVEEALDDLFDLVDQISIVIQEKKNNESVIAFMATIEKIKKECKESHEITVSQIKEIKRNGAKCLHSDYSSNIAKQLEEQYAQLNGSISTIESYFKQEQSTSYSYDPFTDKYNKTEQSPFTGPVYDDTTYYYEDRTTYYDYGQTSYDRSSSSNTQYTYWNPKEHPNWKGEFDPDNYYGRKREYEDYIEMLKKSIAKLSDKIMHGYEMLGKLINQMDRAASKENVTRKYEQRLSELNNYYMRADREFESARNKANARYYVLRPQMQQEYANWYQQVEDMKLQRISLIQQYNSFSRQNPYGDFSYLLSQINSLSERIKLFNGGYEENQCDQFGQPIDIPLIIYRKIEEHYTSEDPEFCKLKKKGDRAFQKAQAAQKRFIDYRNNAVTEMAAIEKQIKLGYMPDIKIRQAMNAVLNLRLKAKSAKLNKVQREYNSFVEEHDAKYEQAAGYSK